MAGSAAPIPPVAIKISAQNEALRELEKARAEIVRLTDTAKRSFGQGFPQAARTSTESVGKLRESFQQLAFQATSIEGPVGRASAALLSVAAGSTLVVGVTGGMAAIATAYKLSTHEIRQFAEANEEALTQQRQLLVQAHPELGPRVSAEDEMRRRQALLDAARARLAELQAPKPGGGAGGRPETLGSEQQITDLNTEITTLTHNLTLAGVALDKVVSGPGEQFITQMEHERDLIGATAEHAAELRAQWAKLSPIEIQQAGDIARQTEARRESVRVMEAQRDLLDELAGIQGTINAQLPSVLAQAQQIGIGVPKFTPFEGIERQKEQAGLDFFKDSKAAAANLQSLEKALRASADAAELAALAHQRTAISIISTASGLIASLVGGGGVGGFLSGLGGLVSFANPLAGAVLGGVGAIAGAAEGGVGRVTIDGYTQRALDQQRKQEESKRNVIVLQVVDPRGNVRDQIYDVTRYQNRGGTAGGIQSRSDGGAVTTRTG